MKSGAGPGHLPKGAQAAGSSVLSVSLLFISCLPPVIPEEPGLTPVITTPRQDQVRSQSLPPLRPGWVRDLRGLLSQRPIFCLHSNQITTEGAGSEPTGRHTGPKTSGTFSASGPGGMVKGSLVPKDCQQSPGNREESGCASCQAQPQYPPYTGSNTDQYLQPSRTPDGRQPQEAWVLGPTQALSDVEQQPWPPPFSSPAQQRDPSLALTHPPCRGGYTRLRSCRREAENHPQTPGSCCHWVGSRGTGQRPSPRLQGLAPARHQSFPASLHSRLQESRGSSW